MKKVYTKKAPEAVGPYSQGMISGGMVFCSGQIPIVPETGDIIMDDVTAATKQCLKNLEAVLKEAGSGLSQIVKCSIFITDMNQFAVINEAYAEMMGDHRPARAVVEVSALPKGVSVEIECIAEL